MQKFFHSLKTPVSKSGSFSGGSSEKVKIKDRLSKTPSPLRDVTISNESLDYDTNMNFDERFKPAVGSTLRDTQTALASALETMDLKEKVINALETEIRSQEEQICSLREELNVYKRRLASAGVREDSSSEAVRCSFPQLTHALPESAYPDLSSAYPDLYSARPKRMAISAEPQTGDNMPIAPTSVDKPEW